jgi:hypothetical protein
MCNQGIKPPTTGGGYTRGRLLYTTELLSSFRHMLNCILLGHFASDVSDNQARKFVPSQGKESAMTSRAPL